MCVKSERDHPHPTKKREAARQKRGMLVVGKCLRPPPAAPPSTWWWWLGRRAVANRRKTGGGLTCWQTRVRTRTQKRGGAGACGDCQKSGGVRSRGRQNVIIIVGIRHSWLLHPVWFFCVCVWRACAHVRACGRPKTGQGSQKPRKKLSRVSAPRRDERGGKRKQLLGGGG